MKIGKYLLAAALAVMISAPAGASLYWWDDFSYADGGLTDYDGADGGTGDNVSGGLWTTFSGATYPGGIDVASGQALLRQGNPASEDAERLTGSVLAAGETLYASFTFSVEDLRGGVESFDGDQSYFIHFEEYRSRVHLRDAVAGGGFTLGLGTDSGEPLAIMTTDLSFDTPYLGILSYEFDTGTSKLWVDPINEASANISDTGTASTGIDSLCMRQDYISAGDHAVVSIDHAAVGTTFADVLPEPTSLALLALGGLAMLRRRK